jgi:hypothetical protein
LRNKFFLTSQKEQQINSAKINEITQKSTIHIPFELKMKEDNRFYAIPSPKKHKCSDDHGNRSMTVEREPAKQTSKYLNFDYYLPRDYKVFDCNMTISPLYRDEEKTCQECLKTLPQLCSKCSGKQSPSPTKMFVNYDKYKTANRESPKQNFDFKFIGDEVYKRAEKLTQPRQDHSPIMKFSEMELKKVPTTILFYFKYFYL